MLEYKVSVCLTCNRTYTLLTLDRECIHQRKEGAREEEDEEQVGEDKMVLQEVQLHHSFVAHSPLIGDEAKKQKAEPDKTANDACTCPRFDSNPVHGEDKACQAASH